MPESAAPREPRSVPGTHAFTWFAEAIRLWKRAPLTFSAMAVVVILATIGLKPVPVVGLLATHVVAPLFICGFYYGSLAADRNDRPRFVHLFTVFAAPLPAQVAVVASAFLVTLTESAVAWYAADINLLGQVADDATLSVTAVVIVVAASALVSLPLAFVPMIVLFDNEPPLRAFASSWRAFVRNPRPLLALAAYTYALTMVGLATSGVGLVLAFPWICAATYVAWKDIFGLGGGDLDEEA